MYIRAGLLTQVLQFDDVAAKFNCYNDLTICCKLRS